MTSPKGQEHKRLRILAIETSGSYASLALLQDETLLAERIYLARKTICSTLASEIRQLLAVAGFSPRDLSAVAVSQGPGSFTSLRVGIATANALAQALKIPLVGVATLHVVAASTSLPPGSSLLAASLSKRSEIYLQYWTNLPPWQPQGLLIPVELSHLAAHLESLGFPVLAGENAQTWLLQAGSPPSFPIELPPRASCLAKLARDLLLSSQSSSLTPPPYLLPLYLRPSQPEEKASP